ncbi:hypothetical protein LY76DRAFT_647802 [Colletotrichum caudatum]|nr:hypothetical protein LY76DRAFT_647802 [Colletotrichum caudatum]
MAAKGVRLAVGTGIRGKAVAYDIEQTYRNSNVDSGSFLFFQPQDDVGQTNKFVASISLEDKDGLVDTIAREEGKTPEHATHPFLKYERIRCSVVQVIGCHPPNVASLARDGSNGTHYPMAFDIL